MKKNWFWILIIGIIALSVIGIVTTDNYARIVAVDYKAVVVDEPGSNGKVIITERLTWDIHAASSDNRFWELWRALPEEWVDGVKVEYRVLSVRQIFEDGTYLEYTESPKLYWYDDDFINTAGGFGPGKWFHSKGPYDEDKRQYECVLIYVDGLYRETVVFEIVYEMFNASLRYNDSSELYIAMYSGNTINHLRSFRGQILFPNAIMPRSGNYEAFTYGTNSHTFPFTKSTTINPGYHTFMFELDESQLEFKPYNQYIEFALIAHGEDRHKFTQHASLNIHFYNDMLDKIRHEQAKYEALPERFKNRKIVMLILFSAGAVITLFAVVKTNKKIKKKNNFFEPTMKFELFRDIPTAGLDSTFVGDLVFCKHKPSAKFHDSYAAAILSLVRKEYIELERINVNRNWDSSNIKVIIKYIPPQMKQQPVTPQFIPPPKRTIVVSKLKESDDSLNSEQKLWMRHLFKSGNTKEIITAFDEFYKRSEGLIDNFIKIESDIIENNDNSLTNAEVSTVDTIKVNNNAAGFCTACGNSLTDELCKFCTNCGSPVNPILAEELSMTPLTPIEEEFLKLLNRHAKNQNSKGHNEIILSSFKSKISTDFQYTTSFMRNIENSVKNIGVSGGYFQKSEYKKLEKKAINWATTMWIWGLMLLIVGNFVSYFTRLDFAFGAYCILGIGLIAGAILLRHFSKKYVLLTQFGEDEYVKWRGLYNFLKSDTLIKDRTIIELPIWEEYLIYATAFGISEKVIKALKIRCPNADSSPMLRNPYFRTRGFYSSGRSFSSATYNASGSSRSGGHGGFGGGGRGGGGGGGGH